MKDEGARLAILTALRDAIDAEVEALRSGLTGRMLEARAELGVKSIDVSLPDGEVVASVSVTDPKVKPSVMDAQAFTDWVAAEAPTEVVPSVRPSYQRAVLDRVRVMDDGRVVDPETGEVVPGLVASSRSPYISMRYKPEGRASIAAAWRESRLPEGVIPQLTGGAE